MNLIAICIAGCTLGILGSLHCIGMCGPIALSISGNFETNYYRIRNIILYNGGRALSYSFMGFLLGLIGNRFALSGYQQILSISAGLFIIGIFIFKYLINSNLNIIKPFNVKIQNILASLMAKPKDHWFYLQVGIVNAWLPCGLVYLALASALTTAHPLGGGLFMLFFGLGTLPLMASLMFVGNYFSQSLRLKLTKAIPFFILFTAILLILRGMNLGIPYISPSIDLINNQVSKCCHR